VLKSGQRLHQFPGSDGARELLSSPLHALNL
jgi:hypothetical protein